MPIYSMFYIMCNKAFFLCLCIDILSENRGPDGEGEVNGSLPHYLKEIQIVEKTHVNGSDGCPVQSWQVS